MLQQDHLIIFLLLLSIAFTNIWLSRPHIATIFLEILMVHHLLRRRHAALASFLVSPTAYSLILDHEVLVLVSLQLLLLLSTEHGILIRSHLGVPEKCACGPLWSPVLLIARVTRNVVLVNLITVRLTHIVGVRIILVWQTTKATLSSRIWEGSSEVIVRLLVFIVDTSLRYWCCCRYRVMCAILFDNDLRLTCLTLLNLEVQLLLNLSEVLENFLHLV